MEHKGVTTGQFGFTLVELMVSVVILGLAITGISELYYSMQRVQAENQNLDIATRAARTEIEVMRNNSYNALNPGSTIDFTSSLPTSLPSDRNGSVDISEPVDGLRRVDVTVTYTNFNKPQTVKLSSEIGVIGIGQGQ